MIWTQGKKNLDMKTSLTLTSTVNSFIVAIFTVSGPIAKFVEMNTFFCPDTLYVIEGASDHHFLCTWNRKTNCQKHEGIWLKYH